MALVSRWLCCRARRCFAAGMIFPLLRARCRDEGRRSRHRRAAAPPVPETRGRGFVLLVPAGKSTQLLPLPQNSVFFPPRGDPNVVCLHKNPKAAGPGGKALFQLLQPAPSLPHPTSGLRRAVVERGATRHRRACPGWISSGLGSCKPASGAQDLLLGKSNSAKGEIQRVSDFGRSST